MHGEATFETQIIVRTRGSFRDKDERDRGRGFGCSDSSPSTILGKHGQWSCLEEYCSNSYASRKHYENDNAILFGTQQTKIG
jgi:hypothetical protein